MIEPAKLSDWLSVVRRARLGRVVKGVAHCLATRANNDGTGLYTGIARLSVECEVSPKVMKTALRTLREAGLITLVHVAKMRGETNEYVLTLPVDGQLSVPTPAVHALEIERVAATLRGKWKSDLRGSTDTAGDTETDDLRGSSDTAGDEPPNGPAGYSRDTESGPAGYSRDDLRGSSDTATSPVPRHERSTSPSIGDEIAAVTVSRATGSDPNLFSDEKGQEPPVLRLVTDEPRPTVGSRRWSSRGADAIAEAMARRAAARANHQNAGETA
jgi:hypothetical protein